MRMTDAMLSFITRRLKMRMVAIGVVTVAIVTILVWGFIEAIDDMRDSNSEEYQKGVEEHEN